MASLSLHSARRLGAAFSAIFLSCLCAAQTTNGTMTLDQAVQMGLQKNPQATAGRAGVLAALANYRALAVLPPITFTASHVSGTSTAPTLNGNNTDTIVDFADTFDLSGQRRYQAAGMNATFRSTLYTFEETLLTLEQQIRDAYWSLAAAQAQTKIADVSLKDAQRVYDLTVEQEKAGASPKGDVIRSSIDVANAKQTLITAQGAEKTALIAFDTLMAIPPTTPTQLADDLGLDSLAPPETPLPDLQALNRQAEQNRPLIKSAIAQTQSAAFSIRQAEASRFPDVNVDYQRSVVSQLDAITLSISFPLLDFGSVRQSIKAAKETHKQTQSQEVQTKQQVANQVAQAHSDMEIAMRAAQSYKKEILDPSVTLLTMAKLGYSQGATGILPVIDAESTIRSARVGYINALVAVYKAQDEILAATGAQAAGLTSSAMRGLKP